MGEAECRSLELRRFIEDYGKSDTMNSDQSFTGGILKVNAVDLMEDAGNRAAIEVIAKNIQTDFSAWLVKG